MKNLATALLKAQAEMPALYNTDVNPHFRSKYAPLHEVQGACLPALRKHGIAVLQGVGSSMSEEGQFMVTVSVTFVHAESGEQWAEKLSIAPSKPDPQGVGSAITYGRRYLLSTMAGVASQDDDGNDASGAQGQQSPRQRQAPKQEPAKESKEKLVALKEIGRWLYQDGWEQKAIELAAHVSGGRTKNIDLLLLDEIDTLLNGMSSIKQQKAQQA